MIRYDVPNTDQRAALLPNVYLQRWHGIIATCTAPQQHKACTCSQQGWSHPLWQTKDQRELVCDNHTQKSHKSSERWSSCTVTFTFTKPGRTEYLRDIACFVVGQSNSQLDNLWRSSRKGWMLLFVLFQFWTPCTMLWAVCHGMPPGQNLKRLPDRW